LNFKQACGGVAEKYRKMKMASSGNKDPIGNLMDKLRSLLGFQERPKNTLPPKAHFSIPIVTARSVCYSISLKGRT
jgi:hypothetical protein